MTERVEEIMRQAETILKPWCVYECDPPRALWVGGASKENHYTTIDFSTVCTACQLIEPVSAALAQAERERDEARAAVTWDQFRRMAEGLNQAEADLARVRAALREIAKGEGAFSRDPLTHAENTIENMKGIARAALEDRR